MATKWPEWNRRNRALARRLDELEQRIKLAPRDRDGALVVNPAVHDEILQQVREVDAERDALFNEIRRAMAS